MSEAKTTMNNNAENVERMGREMAVEARSRPRFVANAMAIWERAHPGRSLTDELQCDEHRLWRLAVTPQPTGAEMARQTMELASALDVNPTALVNMLRFAQSAGAFADANDDGEMLMAALDLEQGKDDLS